MEDTLPIGLVLLDFSGTLADDTKAVHMGASAVRQALDEPALTYDEWRRNVSTDTTKHYYLGGISDRSRAKIQKSLADENDVTNIFRAFSRLQEEDHQPTMIEGVLPFLKATKDIWVTTSVVSLVPTGRLETQLSRLGLDEYMEAVIGGVDDKTEAIKELSEKFIRTVYVGDTVNDIRAAKAAGVETVAVTTGYHSYGILRAENPDYLLPNIGGLLPIIEASHSFRH